MSKDGCYKHRNSRTIWCRECRALPKGYVRNRPSPTPRRVERETYYSEPDYVTPIVVAESIDPYPYDYNEYGYNDSQSNSEPASQPDPTPEPYSAPEPAYEAPSPSYDAPSTYSYDGGSSSSSSYDSGSSSSSSYDSGSSSSSYDSGSSSSYDSGSSGF